MKRIYVRTLLTGAALHDTVHNIVHYWSTLWDWTAPSGSGEKEYRNSAALLVVLLHLLQLVYDLR